MDPILDQAFACKNQMLVWKPIGNEKKNRYSFCGKENRNTKLEQGRAKVMLK